MDQQYYNNLFQIKQHDTFWNLLRVIVNKSKDLESPVNVFWYCFTEIKRYTSFFLMKLVPKNQSIFEILPLFDIWSYQNLVILLFTFFRNIRYSDIFSQCMKWVYQKNSCL